ncbi:MAG TPA: hypothetical protein VL172_13165 [Kofleriaceae bacterium]|nr:hypothetical protein [Kofleriaceae bacterium]
MTDGPTQNGLFRLLDGVPAHAMVIIGLVAALAAPLIPSCASAKREAAEAELEKAKALRELDLKEYNDEQEKKDAAKAAGEVAPVPPPATPEDPDKERKAFEESLDAKYDLAGHERDVAGARAAAAGVRSHLYVHWIGRVLLILGLLIMTLGASGTRQKVLMAVLLIVLFGSLTGVALDVGARATLGGGGS